MAVLRTRTTLLVVQPTPFCNINCSYCYLPSRSSNDRLSLDHASEAFAKLLRFPTIYDDVTIAWHAGEPMTLPVSYYEKAFAIVREATPPRLSVRHSFQTNGTLVNESWCRLLRDWNVSVGVSIDGPQDLHDASRRLRNGRGSFEQSFAGLKQLQAAGLSPHLITVLTSASLERAHDLAAFYVHAGVEYVCLNVEEEEGSNAKSGLFQAESSGDGYRVFFAHFLQEAIALGAPFGIREVDETLASIWNSRRGTLNAQAEPFSLISMDCKGNLSTFSPELLGLSHPRYGSFSVANIFSDDFDAFAQRVEQSTLHQDIRQGVAMCASTCGYYSICGGGAPANKIFENGSAASTETAYCRTLMRTSDVVLDFLDRIPNSLVSGAHEERHRTGM